MTDRQGRLIAASNRTTDYYQADEPWWQEAFDNGARGRVFITGVVHDESARATAINIAAPVANADESQVVGVIKVIVDIRELITIVEGMRLGETGSAALVREDGSLVLARPDTESRFFATDELRRHVGIKRQGGESLYQLHFRARVGDGSARLIGVAPNQLGASYPNLSWVVVGLSSRIQLSAPCRRNRAGCWS